MAAFESGSATSTTTFERVSSPQPEAIIVDRDFLRRVVAESGGALRQCMQCATCSAVCGLANEDAPLPRKEMLWAQWGLKRRLMTDVDIWLCHECHDCTVHCPRGARPGHVLAALRSESVTHYSMPRFAAQAATRPRNLIWFVLVAALLLVSAIAIGDATGATSRELTRASARIVYPFWSRLPHGLLTTLFGAVMLFDATALALGLYRFSRALSMCSAGASARAEAAKPSQSLTSVFKRILWHDDFSRCTHEAGRRVSHSLVVYAMLALIVVDIWVITIRYNGLRVGLVYPLSLSDPWKILANLAGAVLTLGCLMMALDRLRGPLSGVVRPRHSGTYSDWLLLLLLLLITISGFVSEALHFLRLDGPRYLAYTVHLVTVLTLLLMLPYSKLAHVGYRVVALIHAHRRGRDSFASQPGLRRGAG